MEGPVSVFWHQIPDSEEMLGLVLAEKVLNVDDQRLMREDICVKVVWRARNRLLALYCNKGFVEVY